jgi:sec-independent protein translocase protein TatA
MPDVGPVELFLVLVVVVLLFGGTRLAEIGGSLGKGVREFRRNLADDEDEKPNHSADDLAATVGKATPGVICGRCGTANPTAARFCSNCGEGL